MSQITEIPAPSPAPVKPRSKTALICTIAMVFGIMVAAYPFIGSWWNARGQADAIEQYLTASEGLDPEPYFQVAHEYNRRLIALHMTDPYASEETRANEAYWNALKIPTTDVMGRLTLPGAQIDLPIYHGTSDAALQRGVGHLYGSSLPVGGPGTHSVLSGHSGMSDNRMFDPLHKTRLGDHFVVTVLGEEMVYEVDKIQVIEPQEANDTLKLEPGRDLVTLITCTPYAINTHRLLVTGHRIPGNAADNGIDLSQLGYVKLMWILPLAGALCAAGGYGIWNHKRQQRFARQAAMPWLELTD